MVSESPNGAGWHLYRGTGVPGDGISRLPAPPAWRRFDGEVVSSTDDLVQAGAYDAGSYRGGRYLPDAATIDAVNAALYLRRPLLVTGKPGTGKSSLAHSIAHELRLGPVLHWPINSRSSLQGGLYSYDAIGRLQDANLARLGPEAAPSPDIGNYVTLGPLGTAFAGWPIPRVLLIDELDKSDVDLPNDLLTIVEEGEFTIPELVRMADAGPVTVQTSDAAGRVPVRDGRVRCSAFPMVVITSNGEREFPPAFLRRCIRLDVQAPGPEQLAQILAAHLGEESVESSRDLIHRFLTLRDAGDLATDQLMNAIFLTSADGVGSRAEHERLAELVLRRLNSEY
ncbi:MoxR family ATPase [Actinoplanes sp. NPDC049118]|uniref:AAA family ATPase n=1 Tax=Actinoplanes sp. NPDC049118 TaxID=3155769 RepID=UPI00340ECD60